MLDHEFHFVLSFSYSYACGGHSGPQRIVRKVLNAGLYWPSLFHNAYLFCKACEQC